MKKQQTSLKAARVFLSQCPTKETKHGLIRFVPEGVRLTKDLKDGLRALRQAEAEQIRKDLGTKSGQILREESLRPAQASKTALEAKKLVDQLLSALTPKVAEWCSGFRFCIDEETLGLEMALLYLELEERTEAAERVGCNCSQARKLLTQWTWVKHLVS